MEKNEISVFLTYKNAYWLKIYMQMTGKGANETMDEALEQFLAPYHTDDGKLPKTGVTKSGKSVFVLGESLLYGRPHLRIVRDGRILKVPSDQVTICGAMK